MFFPCLSRSIYIGHTAIDCNRGGACACAWKTTGNIGLFTPRVEAGGVQSSHRQVRHRIEANILSRSQTQEGQRFTYRRTSPMHRIVEWCDAACCSTNPLPIGADTIEDATSSNGASGVQHSCSRGGPFWAQCFLTGGALQISRFRLAWHFDSYCRILA